MNWIEISKEPLQEEFIREHKKRVSWYVISKCQPLQEEFIREHKKRVSWYVISKCQTLQESFIMEMKEMVNWVSIASKQKISIDFMLGHIAYMDLYHVKRNPHYKGIETTEVWEELKKKKKETLQSYLKILPIQNSPLTTREAIEYIGDILLLKDFFLAETYHFLEVKMVVPLQFSMTAYVTFSFYDGKTGERTLVPFNQLYENEKEKQILKQSIRSFLQEQGQGRKTLRFE